MATLALPRCRDRGKSGVTFSLGREPGGAARCTRGGSGSPHWLSDVRDGHSHPLEPKHLLAGRPWPGLRPRKPEGLGFPLRTP